MNILDIATNEPALITGFVNAAVALGIAFGLPITADEKLALGAFVIPAINLLSAIWTRQSVTPNTKL